MFTAPVSFFIVIALRNFHPACAIAKEEAATTLSTSPGVLVILVTASNFASTGALTNEVTQFAPATSPVSVFIVLCAVGNFFATAKLFQEKATTTPQAGVITRLVFFTVRNLSATIGIT